MRFGTASIGRWPDNPVAIVINSFLFLLLCTSLSVQAQPVISSFSPTTVCQGNTVTITGSGFTGATIVRLGSLNASNISVPNDNTIIATVADYATSGNVTVTTNNGAHTSPGTLTIQQAPKPALYDIGTLDAQFTNCNGNTTYVLKVRNSSTDLPGSGYSYEINWGDATTSFTQTDWPVNATTNHTYNSHGYYNIVFTITAPGGCVVSRTYQFYNGKNPLASFTTTNPTTGLCVPAPVEFQIGNWFNNSAGTKYEIDFGDGTPSVTLPHPLNAGNIVQLVTHTYNTSSCPKVDFTAKLNATNGCFTTTYTLNQIIVRKKPTADFNTNIPPPCINSPVCLQNKTIDGNSGNTCNPNSNFTWDFGDGTAVSNLIDPCHTFTSSGTFTITLTAANAACGGDTKSKQITILAPSQPPVVPTPVTYCQGQPATQLTASGTSLLWYTSATGGTGSAIAPTPSTNTPGTRTWYVSQTTPGNCEGPREPVTVTVNPSPATPQVTSPVQLCQNQTATALTATGTDLLWYAVQTGGTGTATAPTPNTTTVGSTTYYVSQTVNGCEGPRAVITVYVNALATAPGVVSPINYCENDPAIPLKANGTGLLWYDVVTGGTGSSTAPTPNTSTVGTTTWYVSQVTGCGEGPRTSITVNVNARPSATISYSPASLCNVVNSATTPNPPVAVTFTGTTGGTYSAVPASGLPINTTTGEINPSGATAGTYTIKYTIPGSGGCANYSVTATVTVNGVPVAAIQYAGSPFCSGSNTLLKVTRTGSAGGSFSSDPGLSINATTGDIDPSLSTPGVYTVSYIILPSGPCPGYTAKTQVTVIESPVISFSPNSQAICSGSTAVFTPSSTVANTVYKWSVVGALPSNVSGISSGTTSGAISLSFTNSGANGQPITIQVIPANPVQSVCTGTPYNLTLMVNPVPPAPKPDTAHFCMGASATALHVDPMTGTTIKWYDQNQAPLPAAPVINTNTPAQFIYYISQAYSNGCESPKSKLLAIVHPTATIVSSSYTNPTSCGLPSGTIVLNVLDLNNNAITNLPVVVHYDKFMIAYTAANKTDASGKITIPLVAGTYSNIYVETGIGCMSQNIPDVYVLKDPNPPAQPVAGYNPPVCSENLLQLTALSPTSTQAGAIDYVWAGPAFGPLGDTVRKTTVTFTSAPVSYAGTYIVYAIQNNCISSPTSFQVAIKQSPTKPRITTRNPLCIGDDLVLQAASAMPGNSAVINYTWKGPGAGLPVNAPVARVNKVRLEDAGIYTITAWSPATGCSSSTDTLIQIGGYPIVKFSQDTVTVPTGFLLKLAPDITNATSPGILPMKNLAWNPSQDVVCNDAICSTPVATIKNNTCYAVKATNIYGCSGSDTLCVKVFCTGSQVFLPNAFAPRGNVPENTKLIVRASGIASVKAFRVFNRWGKVVFEKNNFAPNSPDFGWDGYVNGRLADPGVYIYTVDVICENGVPYTYKGNVTLF